MTILIAGVTRILETKPGAISVPVTADLTQVGKFTKQNSSSPFFRFVSQPFSILIFTSTPCLLIPRLTKATSLSSLLPELYYFLLLLISSPASVPYTEIGRVSNID